MADKIRKLRRRAQRPLTHVGWSRREVLHAASVGLGWLLTSNALTACAKSGTMTAGDGGFGPLGEPDDNGIRLPSGFSSRVVARSGEVPAAGGNYRWPPAPDGGATFATADGGWIYVSNSEMLGNTGGVAALRFDSAGNVIDAYPILQGTNRNCAGGVTPWGTWLSCEEIPTGRVWECDPTGERPAIVLPALGVFNHEAVAVDAQRRLYLTEDDRDGRLYRFTPATISGDGLPDLTAGLLEVAQVTDAERQVVWHAVPDPAAGATPTRRQVAESTPFDRGEGMWFHQDVVYFTTTGDNRVWAYDCQTQLLTIIYDAALAEHAELTGVDNVVVSAGGDVLVAEDGGDLQIVAVTEGGRAEPVMQLVGQPLSEIAGPAFDPSGTRLYFSSQRGKTGRSEDGITYEIRGPFVA